MRRPPIAPYLATAVAHGPLAFGLWWLLAERGLPGAAVLAIGVVGLLTAALRGRLALLRWDRPISRARRLLCEEPYFAHLGAAALSNVLVFPLLLFLRALASLAGWHAPWLECAASAALGSYGLALGLSSWLGIVRPRSLRVRPLEVEVSGLGAAFDGLRIVQLSDLHVGSLCPPARAARWVARANALGADLVVLTGDYVTTGTRFHADAARVLGALRAPAGVVAVAGNHDYFGDGEPLFSLLRAQGIRLLRNERVILRRGNDRLCIAGVDDTHTRRADVAATMQSHESDGPVIALAHDPRLGPELARLGALLVMSGHTHVGQVARLGWLVQRLARGSALAWAGWRHGWRAGLFREGRAWLIVSGGLGSTGPPLRLGGPPELVLVRLRTRTRSAMGAPEASPRAQCEGSEDGPGSTMDRPGIRRGHLLPSGP